MALALLLLFLLVPPPALASPPAHPALPGLTLVGAAPDPGPLHPSQPFDHACGVAVDSKGDVYVSSGGNDAIDVFDASHKYLKTIANSNEPCGLAVDSKGNLYASERTTGKVVRYAPDAFPFVGAPTYGPPTTIDSSGDAKGVAVDPFDDRLYVAKGDRVDAYKSDGSFSASIGVGQLTNATGVAAYTYGSEEIFVFAADSATDEITVFTGASIGSLTVRQTINGSNSDAFTVDKTPDNGFGFENKDTYLTVDRANGHVLVFDAEHNVVDEFEATGHYLTQIVSPEFDNAEPTAIAVYSSLSEVQRVQTNATGGSFTLTFEGQTTGPIAFNAKAPAVKTALEALSTIDPGDIYVEDLSAGGLPSRAYGIGFIGDRRHSDVPSLECTPALTGGTGACTVTPQPDGSGPGRIYVTSGDGAGSKLLAFAALAQPGRALRPDLSFTLKSANSIAVDDFGNRYVSAGASIGVYPPDSNTPLISIADPGSPYDLAVDSECNLYALERNAGSPTETVEYFTPNACPPKAGTKYSGPTTVATSGPPYFPEEKVLLAIGRNPKNDHIFVTQQSGPMIELDSASNGSTLLNPDWGTGLSIGGSRDVDACGATGNIYASSSNGSVISVVNPAGTAVLARISGKGSFKGGLKALTHIAVNQANCHVLAFSRTRGVAEEYEASGAFVSEFGSFATEASVEYRIAVDSSGGPSDGNVYVAFDDTAPGTFDLTAFDPLSYGEPPLAVTGEASDVGGGKATLNGTVNPRTFELEECHFEYTTAADFSTNGFGLATDVPCVETPEEIGKGAKPIPVHAALNGLDAEEQYHFRLVAHNEFGSSEGSSEAEDGIFGPPIATTKPAQPIAYTEATLRALVDPSGLETEYRFEYGKTEGYGQLTSPATLSPSDGPTEVVVPIFGLQEGDLYHFRVVAQNEAGPTTGLDKVFTTLKRPTESLCPNTEFRTGRSAGLPDCRAYELVTPAETRGIPPKAGNTITHQFSNWLVPPGGDGAGERISFVTEGTLPGFDGNGILDSYRAHRSSGLHPKDGWSSELFSASYVEAAVSFATLSSLEGISLDQEYSLWALKPAEGTLAKGSYIRGPLGFEPLGLGSLGADPDAESHYASSGGDHLVFSSKAHLEPDTPLAAADTTAIYDRSVAETVAEVISLKPDGAPFGSGENAAYLGSTEDGSAIAFKVAGALYLHRNGKTLEIAKSPNTFAGISADGQRVFYVDASVVGPVPAAATLEMCDVGTGGCVGSGSHAPTQIAPASRFVNVSTGGTHVYFTSTEVLDDDNEGTLGEDNLYLWQAASETIRFVALLHPEDLDSKGFQGLADNLVRWTDAIGGSVGRAASPARSTSDGSVLVFQSHANLTAYDSDGQSEVYLYDSTAAPGAELTCVSCAPSGVPPNGDSMLQELRAQSSVNTNVLIANVTEDGKAVFFQSEDSLLPEDANSAQDVYKWEAQGTSDCERVGGCLSLISSGQGENDSVLYGMTFDGHDVFFSTQEKLVGADITGSPSLYDARVEGGIPDPPLSAPCQGDACQPLGNGGPAIPAPASDVDLEDGNVKSEPSLKCAKGKRKVRLNGKARCVKKHKKRHQRKHQRRGRG